MLNIFLNKHLSQSQVLERLAEMYFSKEDIKDPLSITELEVRTKLNIKGTGITRNSL